MSRTALIKFIREVAEQTHAQVQRCCGRAAVGVTGVPRHKGDGRPA